MPPAKNFTARMRDCLDYLRFALTHPELKLQPQRKAGQVEATSAYIDGLCRAIDDYGKAVRSQRRY